MNTLQDWKLIYSNWLFDAALPLWWERGADKDRGGFHEVLDMDGNAPAVPRRARVQARQSFVYALAGQLDWGGPWKLAAEQGLAFLDVHYRRPDGLFRTLVARDGKVINDAAMSYDQAFALLAAAKLYEMQPQRGDLKSFALRLVGCLIELRQHPAGGFWEEGEVSFLSNPHMHLLEAALAWIEADGEAVWQNLADQVVHLCLTRFIDPKKHVLREYFDAEWQPLAGDLGRSIEPGHQFEWAWLLERWANLRGRSDVHAMARALFQAGLSGVDPKRNVAVDELDDDLSPRREAARLWPQTERLKAALILMQPATGEAHEAYAAQACAAAQSLWGYLQVPLNGLWRDKMLPDGRYVGEPAPASSLYHIICAVASLQEI